MNHKISLAGATVLTAAKQVANLCKPLINNLNIQWFRYMKVFKDGSKFILCNEPSMMQFMYEEGHYHNTWYDNGKPASHFQPGCHSWAIDKLSTTHAENWLEQEIFQHFKYSDGVFFCIQQPDTVEHFDFISESPHIYHIKKQLLYRFILYFKEQAKKLIARAPDEKIVTPMYTKPVQKIIETCNELEFIHKTPIATAHLPDANIAAYFNNQTVHYANPLTYMSIQGVSLSTREQEVLYYLPKGKSAKQIALILGISYRTVERHLENIKAKMGCYSKSALIEKLFSAVK